MLRYSDILGQWRWATILIAIIASTVVASPAVSAQSRAVTPPCGVAPVPPYAPVGSLPAILTGPGAALPPSLDMNACVHWDARAVSLVILLSGSFRDDRGVQDVLARFGAISRRVNMPAWSAADHRWEAGTDTASAVTGADGEVHRGDFSVAELANGTPHFFVQEDPQATGEVIYSLQVRELTAKHLVITSDNVSPIRNYFIRLYDPGDLKATYYLDQRAPGVWGFYSLSGIQESPTTGDQANSFGHRAEAMFRLIATMGR